MQIAVFPDKLSLAEAAANDAANAICKAVEHDGLARIIAAPGASQHRYNVKALEALEAGSSDWSSSSAEDW
jgi:glucosamine-6-phosphate deaminase